MKLENNFTKGRKLKKSFLPKLFKCSRATNWTTDPTITYFTFLWMAQHKLEINEKFCLKIHVYVILCELRNARFHECVIQYCNRRRWPCLTVKALSSWMHIKCINSIIVCTQIRKMALYNALLWVLFLRG